VGKGRKWLTKGNQGGDELAPPWVCETSGKMRWGGSNTKLGKKKGGLSSKSAAKGFVLQWGGKGRQQLKRKKELKSGQDKGGSQKRTVLIKLKEDGQDVGGAKYGAGGAHQEKGVFRHSRHRKRGTIKVE